MEWAFWALSKTSQNFFVWRCTLKFISLICHAIIIGQEKKADWSGHPVQVCTAKLYYLQGKQLSPRKECVVCVVPYPYDLTD